ncbi:MAG: right-handed parallel beta-helix repeat-containing protein [Nostoc sp. LLA-1]|nr:right-handed parallel beta-helix repeat-containing protein [Cyanocohniella sp. LLY]
MVSKNLRLKVFLVLPWILSSVGGVPKTSAAVAPSPNSQPQLVSMNSGTTYYVSGSGNDDNNGRSTSSAFRTIQRAANLTQPGDTVLIMNGEYRNSGSGHVVHITRSGNANAWITYKAHPGHSPKIKHNAWHGIEIDRGASYIEINGLEVEGNNANISLDYARSQKSNGGNHLTNGNCITVDGRKNGRSRHIRILNNKVHNCGGGGINFIQADYVTVDGNEVFNNAWYSVYANSGISMWQNWNSDNNTTDYKMIVTNNRTYNNRQNIEWLAVGRITDGNGIIIDDSRNAQNGSTLGRYRGRTLVANNVTYKNGGSGIHSYLSDNIDIINNTAVLNNQSPELQGGQIFATDSSNVRVLNNILHSFPGKRMNGNKRSSNVTFNYNIYANGGEILVRGANDIVADPQFVNFSNNDFRLKSNSPGIDKGTNFSAVKTDIAGNRRPSGSGFDIGAYEYQHSGNPTTTNPTTPPPDCPTN